MWGAILGGLASGLFGGGDSGGIGGSGQQAQWNPDIRPLKVPKYYQPSSNTATPWNNPYSKPDAQFYGMPNAGAGMMQQPERIPQVPPYAPSMGYIPTMMKGQKWGSDATDQQRYEWNQYREYTKADPVTNFGTNVGHWFKTGRWGS